METIKEAKAYLRANYKTGIGCPCCAQYVRMYRRKLNSGMAIALMMLYDSSLKNAGYVHIEELFISAKRKTTHDWALLRFWGFIEEMPRIASEKVKSNGKWKITLSGISFLLGKTDAKKYIYLYNNKLITLPENVLEISFKACFGEKFNYNELMENVSPFRNFSK